MICRVLNVARSTAYYREHERVPVIDEVLARRIKTLIDAEPYLGYRTVCTLLREQGFIVNRKAVQRVMQLKGWQCRRGGTKRRSPTIENKPNSTSASTVRWARESALIWTRIDGLVFVNVVLDCGDHECIGLYVSQHDDERGDAGALEDALRRRRESAVPEIAEQSELAERFIRGLKIECILQQRFETFEEAKAAITAWVERYNESLREKTKRKELGGA